jgi:hypothetical protein
MNLTSGRFLLSRSTHMKYAKGIVAVIGAGVLALQVALDDGVILSSEWPTIAIAVITAVGVYLVPNKTV